MLKRLDAKLGILAGAGIVILALGVMTVLDRRPEPATDVRVEPAPELRAEPATEARPEGSPEGAGAAEVAEPPEAAERAALFSLVPGLEGCSWEVRELPDTVPSVLRATDDCPNAVLWMGRPGESDLIYEYYGTLTRIGASGEEETLSLPESSLPLGSVVHFWVDDESARLRVGYLPTISCAQDGGRCTYDLGTRTIQSERDEDGGERFVMEDGWAVAPIDDADGRSIAPWGIRGVAVAYESDPTGGWTMVSAAPTRSEAGDTPGLAVLDISEASGSVSLYDLRVATTCLGQLRSSTGCEEHDGALPSSVSQRLGGDYEVRSLSSEGGTWIFPVVWGDSPHIRGPVFLECGPGCEPARLSLPIADAAQLSLDVRGPYLLVGREHSVTEGAIFAPGSTEPLLTLPATASSVWLPR